MQVVMVRCRCGCYHQSRKMQLLTKKGFGGLITKKTEPWGLYDEERAAKPAHLGEIMRCYRLTAEIDNLRPDADSFVLLLINS